jgi:predicted permease
MDAVASITLPIFALIFSGYGAHRLRLLQEVSIAALSIAGLTLPAPVRAFGEPLGGAALPAAANVFVLAQRYGIYVDRASSAVFVSTLLSVVTVTVWLVLLRG